MVFVIDLGISAHEINAASVPETRCITMIPLAVELNEIPVMIAPVNRISLDHHVRDSCLVKEHLAAGIVYVAVSRTFRETSVSCLRIRKASAMNIVDVAMNPVKDIPGSLDVILSPEAGHDL